VVGWLAEAMRGPEFCGHLTGGALSANLMGLAMAREVKSVANETGLACGGVVYASSEIPMSIPKSVALVGIGRSNLRLIATDESSRMIPEELDATIVADKAAGKTPLAVVALAGSVSPAPLIRSVRSRRFPTDMAPGFIQVVPTVPSGDRRSPKIRWHRTRDSISLDPHKWLYQPLDCGCLLYRSPEAARLAFSHTGDYARGLSAEPVEGFVFFEESMELSRRFRPLKLWL
jgi:aromatic-L-amino-acid decarboxylase